MAHFINEQILKYLELKGRTQVDLAHILGYTKASVSRKLSSERLAFHEKQLEAIGELLNAPFAQMARDAVKMSNAFGMKEENKTEVSEDAASYGVQSRSVMALKMNIAQLEETRGILIQELGDLRRTISTQEMLIESLRAS
jgi:transcriptional regulator with XRE-family HTH domain